MLSALGQKLSRPRQAGGLAAHSPGAPFPGPPRPVPPGGHGDKLCLAAGRRRPPLSPVTGGGCGSPSGARLGWGDRAGGYERCVPPRGGAPCAALQRHLAVTAAPGRAAGPEEPELLLGFGFLCSRRQLLSLLWLLVGGAKGVFVLKRTPKLLESLESWGCFKIRLISR